MNMLLVYFVVGLAVAALASVVSDRFHTRAGVTALLAGLLWPLVLIGAVQVALWMAVASAVRAASPRSQPQFAMAGAGPSAPGPLREQT